MKTEAMPFPKTPHLDAALNAADEDRIEPLELTMGLRMLPPELRDPIVESLKTFLAAATAPTITGEMRKDLDLSMHRHRVTVELGRPAIETLAASIDRTNRRERALLAMPALHRAIERAAECACLPLREGRIVALALYGITQRAEYPFDDSFQGDLAFEDRFDDFAEVLKDLAADPPPTPAPTAKAAA